MVQHVVGQLEWCHDRCAVEGSLLWRGIPNREIRVKTGLDCSLCAPKSIQLGWVRAGQLDKFLDGYAPGEHTAAEHRGQSRLQPRQSIRDLGEARRALLLAEGVIESTWSAIIYIITGGTHLDGAWSLETVVKVELAKPAHIASRSIGSSRSAGEHTHLAPSKFSPFRRSLVKNR